MEAAYAQSRHLGASKGCFGVRATEVHMEAEYMQANSFARSRQLGASSGRPVCTIEVSRCKLGPLSRQSVRRALGGGVHASERICTIEASRCMFDMCFSLHCDHSRLLDACSGLTTYIATDNQCTVHNRGFSVHAPIDLLCTIEVSLCIHLSMYCAQSRFLGACIANMLMIHMIIMPLNIIMPMLMMAIIATMSRATRC